MLVVLAYVKNGELEGSDPRSQSTLYFNVSSRFFFFGSFAHWLILYLHFTHVERPCKSNESGLSFGKLGSEQSFRKLSSLVKWRSRNRKFCWLTHFREKRENNYEYLNTVPFLVPWNAANREWAHLLGCWAVENRTVGPFPVPRSTKFELKSPF